MKNSRPGMVGIHVLGSHGVGAWPSVMQSDADCQLAPRSG
jgi:hypothetical protein